MYQHFKGPTLCFENFKVVKESFEQQDNPVIRKNKK